MSERFDKSISPEEATKMFSALVRRMSAADTRELEDERDALRAQVKAQAAKLETAVEKAANYEMDLHTVRESLRKKFEECSVQATAIAQMRKELTACCIGINGDIGCADCKVDYCVRCNTGRVRNLPISDAEKRYVALEKVLKDAKECTRERSVDEQCQTIGVPWNPCPIEELKKSIKAVEELEKLK